MYTEQFMMDLSILRKFSFIFIINFYYSSSICSTEEAAKTLRHVQVFWRGGLHSLDQRQTFPNLRNPFKLPLTILTTEGEWTGYKIGQKLKDRYDFLMDQSYNPFQVRFLNGGEQNRTMATALLVAAAFFPPKTKMESWNENLKWQPVSVHEDEKLGHMGAFLLAIRQDCPSLNYFKNTSKFKLFCQKNEEFIKFICSEAQTPDLIARYAFVASTALSITSQYKDSSPPWANETVINTAFKYYYDMYNLLNSENNILKLTAGYPLGLILEEMKTYLSGNLKRKFVGYAVHDDMLSPMMAVLAEKPPKNFPQFGSFFSLELHKADFIELWYWLTPDAEGVKLSIKNCSNACSFSKFSKTFQKFIPEDWDSECSSLSETSALKLTKSEVKLGVSVFLLFLFGCLTISFGLLWYRNWKRLRNSPQFDQTPMYSFERRYEPF